MHLSDFVVLHLLRQGKITLEQIKMVRAQFELCDRDGLGRLTLEQATAGGVLAQATAIDKHSGRDRWPEV